MRALPSNSLATAGKSPLTHLLRKCIRFVSAPADTPPHRASRGGTIRVIFLLKVNDFHPYGTKKLDFTMIV